MRTLKTLLTAIKRGMDFEDARDALHALGPEAAAAILKEAGRADARVLPVLVMVLADTVYPPALPAMRQWLDHEDEEGVVGPAIYALNQATAAKLDVDAIYGHRRALAAAAEQLAARWDAGENHAPSEEAWLAAQLAKRRAAVEEVPPPDPDISAAERDSLRERLIRLNTTTREWALPRRHALDLAATRRALPIYESVVPGDRRLRDAIAAVAAFLAGELDEDALEAHEEPVRAALREADRIADYNKVYRRYRRPAFKAAAHAAQAVLYLVRLSSGSRLQPMHYSRYALAYSGAGFEAVEAELDWQLAEMDAS
ncbi:MAG: hypothetical protein KC486_09165 [Myxococcales bacterium]|nr:hypothetical protein [Myxococcales bacterium]